MTDAELIARLREDVFYGDDRLHNLSRHNPLHMEAADRIKDLVERNKELALQLLATQGQVADRIEAAKAAAQADYEARIMSALDMYPTVSPDVAGLLDAAEKVINSYWNSTDGVITGIYDLEATLARVKGVM